MVPGQDNVIAVKVNNAHDPDVAPLSADFTFFGGIYRNVSLQVTDPLAVRMLDYAGPGVYLRQRSVDRGVRHASTSPPRCGTTAAPPAASRSAP